MYESIAKPLYITVSIITGAFFFFHPQPQKFDSARFHEMNSIKTRFIGERSAPMFSIITAFKYVETFSDTLEQLLLPIENG